METIEKIEKLYEILKENRKVKWVYPGEDFYVSGDEASFELYEAECKVCVEVICLFDQLVHPARCVSSDIDEIVKFINDFKWDKSKKEECLEYETREKFKKHQEWLEGRGGERAVINHSDLHGIGLCGTVLEKIEIIGSDISDANLRRINMSGAEIDYSNMENSILDGALLYKVHSISANFKNASLKNVDFGYADLSFSNFERANLLNSDLKYAELTGAILTGANMGNVDLRYADLTGAILKDVNLTGADLTGAILKDVNLAGTNLTGAILEDADMRGTELEGTIGLLSSIEYINNNFEKVENGIIGYVKCSDVSVAKGDVLNSNVNHNRSQIEGCGINVVTEERMNLIKGNFWKVLIKFEWLSGICVPYGTSGEIRCERVVILEKTGAEK